MKKIIFLLFVSLFLLSCSFPDQETILQSAVQDSGDIEVYFCPQDKCDEVLVNFIDSAEESVHCALFDIGLRSVKDVLDKKAKQDKLGESNIKKGGVGEDSIKKIDVKVIIDNNYLKKYTRPFVKTDSWSLMHNKFCIIDGKRFSTGSMNPTDNGAFKNNNNLLLIESKVLVNNYEAEFQEMWNGTFKKGDEVLNPVVNLETETPDNTDSTILVKNYFCPEDNCAEQVKEELKKAKESIHFMTFSFTHDGIANILLLKNQEGIDVKGVMEARQISKYSKFELLKFQGIDVVKDGNKNNMHHKVFIIDNKTVITGSFNPTNSGNERNDENLLIIHDEGIAEKFLEEFGRI